MRDQEVRVLSATGMLGSGFRRGSFDRGLEMQPHLIGVDAGSTDGGPCYLATGAPYFPDDAVERDLSVLLRAAVKNHVPLVVGSAGMSGADESVDKVVSMVIEIAEKERLSFRLAAIYSEQESAYLIERFRAGAMRPLAGGDWAVTEQQIRSATRIVGMAGAEPFIDAIRRGADVVIAGRSSDASIFACVPLMMGADPATAWHAAKVLECGAGAVEQRLYPDCLFATIRGATFVVEAPNPELACTPLSVASHNLYETASPLELVEPGCTIKLDGCRYEALDSCRVRVSGARFCADDYTIRLEGVEFVGYQAYFLGAIRDPVILRQLGSWLDRLRLALAERFVTLHGEDVRHRYRLTIRRYGVDGVMALREPTPIVGHEVALVFEVLADTQELAMDLIKVAVHFALHFPVPEWSGLISTLAFPYSPPETMRGPVYRFSLNHVVKPTRIERMFRTTFMDV